MQNILEPFLFLFGVGIYLPYLRPNSCHETSGAAMLKSPLNAADRKSVV